MINNIPFLDFNGMHKPIKSEIMQAIEQVFDSNWFVLGNQVKQFESEYSVFGGTKYTIGVSNGLDALRLALIASGVKENDEVIVPSNTYIATVLAISSVGAKPVLVEPNPLTYNITAESIAPYITDKTKCIMPVHLYGQSCEMQEIVNLIEGTSIQIVEDNAQSQGAVCNNKITGSWGIANATSFYPGKNLGALGDAGAVTTNSEAIAKRVETLRNYGSNKKYYNDEIGYNMRLDELQAAVLSVKLKYLPSWIVARQEAASIYLKHLANVNEVVLPVTAKNCSHTYHLFVIQVKNRAKLQEFLLNNGVQTMIHYPVPPHLQKAYSYLNLKEGSFPIAENLANSMLSLPLFPGISSSQIEKVCDLITRFYKNGGR